MQKLKGNDRFCMNEVFRGAFGSKLDPYDVKNYAGDDSEVRFGPKPCLRGVLKDFFFNLDFFVYFWLPIKIETPISIDFRIIFLRSRFTIMKPPPCVRTKITSAKIKINKASKLC